MIEDLLPKSYRHYLSFPILGSSLEDFAIWLQRKGYTFSTIKTSIKQTKRIEGFLNTKAIQSIKDISPQVLKEMWDFFHQTSPNIPATVRRLKSYLEERHGLNTTLPTPPTPINIELDQYKNYLIHVRGWTQLTIQAHSRYIHEFLVFFDFDNKTDALSTLCMKEIERFVCQCAARQNRYTLQHVIAYVRGFLRYEYEKGILPNPLHMMIDTPRVYRQEKLPRCLPWETVRTFLHSIDRSITAGIRDYTMLFLIATYGLRRCEVVKLKLDDIDWRSRTISIHQRKGNNPLMLPLTDDVADVLIQYCKKGLSNFPDRFLFSRNHAPIGPLKPTAVTKVFQRWVRESGLDIPYKGPHCLRHSYAVHLLRQGTSTKSIGDLLGHKSEESTCVYLRLAIEDLREAALPVPQSKQVLDPAIIHHIKTSPIILPNRIHQQTPSHSRRVSTMGWRSFLAGEIQDYLRLKRSLGREYKSESRTFHAFDDLLAEQFPIATEISAEMFHQWSSTLSHLRPTVRRKRMLQIRNFCLYCRRSQPLTFVPDLLTFPTPTSPSQPYHFSEQDMARLINATQYLPTSLNSPIRAQTMRLAFILLYTCGLRREELLRLRLEDFDASQTLLRIEASKFHKSRVIPLHPLVVQELEGYLILRRKIGLPIDTISPLIWNRHNGSSGRRYTGTGLLYNWTFLCSALRIFTYEGKTPRIHDARHSFAINVLQGWYRQGKDVQAKLPMLSTYMGHVSIVSTQYYLQFVEAIRSEASIRFYKTFGSPLNAETPEQSVIDDPREVNHE